LPGGETVQAVTYSVVFLSIVFTSVLSFLIEKTHVSRLYAAIFRRFGRQPSPVVVAAEP